MATIDATVGGANANSYGTEAEALIYFDERLPLVPAWDDAENKPGILIMATRVLEAMFRPGRLLVRMADGNARYLTRRTWTGSPATTTQRLAWPRTGMYDGNGNAIDDDVIPQDLKNALFEFAGQLNKGDTTLNNDVVVQGLTSLRAGSVSLSFKDGIIPQVVPDAVLALIPPSWLTDEIWESAMGSFELNIVSNV